MDVRENPKQQQSAFILPARVVCWLVWAVAPLAVMAQSPNGEKATGAVEYRGSGRTASSASAPIGLSLRAPVHATDAFCEIGRSPYTQRPPHERYGKSPVKHWHECPGLQ